MNEAWRKSAACQGVPTHLFYSEGVRGASATQTQSLKFCQTCPVRIDCLLFAFRTHQNYGVWGGMHAHDRDTARRRWAKEVKMGKKEDDAAKEAVQKQAEAIAKTKEAKDAAQKSNEKRGK